MTTETLDIVYDIPKITDTPSRHTLAVLVDNEFGVLARVIGLFSGRGYNIESLTVAEVEHEKKLSRITIVTSGTEHVVEQIKKLLERMVPVHKVHDLTVEGAHVERELALVKIAAIAEERQQALKTADMFRARVIDSTEESFVFELTGEAQVIDQFIAMMTPLGLIEICRTGIAAVSRGKQGI
ncbi:MAG: acetolactate synthase small subunit [Rickettsiales bacterium]|jgi:acetolactate synthase-1/3 small subunit|nr:acetolactate synthase small subunit [Rickettsiales bacterium]